nr:hypothetical protein [Tanacetum cinerariifolium]
MSGLDDTLDATVKITKITGSSTDLNLSFGDALYLHPNNTGGSLIVTIKLTRTENYIIWSIAMTFALRNHNKLGFIDGTCERDKNNLALANQWDMCNSVVVTWILNSLSPELFASAIYAKNAYEMWTDLKDTYDKVDGSAVFNIHKKLEKHNQLIKLMQFLMGLDDSYLAIRSNILSRETLPLIKQAFAIISGEESHRNATSYRNFNAKPAVFNNASTDVFAKNSGTDNKTSNSLVSLTSDQLSRLMNLLNDNGVSSANSSMGGNILKTIKGSFFNNSVKFNLNSKTFFNGNTNFLVGNISLGWITDSGANQHMTVSTKFLVNVIDVSNLGLTVGHPNENQALITKIRDLKINNKITLYDVLVVPEYTVSLLYVHKLARDSKLLVGFDEHNCYFHNLKGNKTMRTGRQCNGLYLFDIEKDCKIISNNCIATCYVSRSLWHQRLGHPADQVLSVLNKNLNLDSQSVSDHLCDICNKAKQSREPFSLSDHKSTKLGQLIHLDVWGPYKVTSRDGFRYFLSAVDDFSRADSFLFVIWQVTFLPISVCEFNDNTEPISEISDLPINTIRRSTKQTKLPSSLNDFIINGKVKYGVEKVVNYGNLDHSNLCFASSLNKSIEPTCYEHAILDSNWIDAMNTEIEALNKNHTWIITDLPANRKPIKCKWIYKIKYKSNGDIERYKAGLVAKGFSQR